MHLAALSAGAQAPRRHFNGAVHSVFREACNVRLDDGRMLTLLASQLGNVPHGVRVATPAGFDFARQVALRQRVGCRADVLRIAGTLSIDLSPARTWRGELPAAGVDLTTPQVSQAWRASWHALQRGQPRADRADCRLLTRAVDREAVRLAGAARALQVDEAATVLNGLVGRGPGLTPSGDDVIIGLLAGLWSTAGDDLARRAFLDSFAGAVAAAAAGTGDISRVYLSYAARGHFVEPLITLVQCIGEAADRRAIEAATAAALRVGHTSGGDGVFGLLLGLGGWAPASALPGRAAPDTSLPGSIRTATARGMRVPDSRSARRRISGVEHSRVHGHANRDPAGRRIPGAGEPVEAVATRFEIPAGRCQARVNVVR